MSDLRSSHSPFSPRVKPRKFLRERKEILERVQIIGAENEKENNEPKENEKDE